MMMHTPKASVRLKFQFRLIGPKALDHRQPPRRLFWQIFEGRTIHDPV
jgi:hypothetical protein